MPQTGTQTSTDQQRKHIIIAFSESSKRMPKAAAAADDRVDQGSLRTSDHVFAGILCDRAGFRLAIRRCGLGTWPGADRPMCAAAAGTRGGGLGRRPREERFTVAKVMSYEQEERC